MSRRRPGSRFHRAIKGQRWELTRLRIFERDGWRCTSCGRPGRLECHHIEELHRGGDPFDPDNLLTLCRSCHIAAHARKPAPAVQAWKKLVEST